MKKLTYVLLLALSVGMAAQSQTNQKPKLDPVYKETVGDYLPFYVKFQPQATALGPAAMKNLKDVVNFLKHRHAGKLVAVGYSKSGADITKCEKIAEQRTLVVKQALENIYPNATQQVIYNSGGIDEGFIHAFTGSSDIVVFYEQDFLSYSEYYEARRNASKVDDRAVFFGALIGAMFDSSLGDTSCSYCNGSGSVGGELCPRCRGNRTQFSEGQAWADAGKKVNQARNQASKNATKASGIYKAAGPNGYQVKEYDDGLYEGYLVNGKRNGSGIFHWINGKSYTGQWKNDKMEGRGILRTVGDLGKEARYAGLFRSEKLIGECAYRSENGDLYIGEIDSNDRFAGKGKIFYANGSKYIGNLHYGFPEGEGTLTYSDGSRYVGSFRSGFTHGSGVMDYPDGSRIEGNWHVGTLKKGTRIWPNGTKYKGEFKNGTGTGKGIIIFKDGTTCEGTFTNYKANGWCTYKEPNGNQWLIEYINERGNGFGCYFDVSNQKYIKGIWKDSQLDTIIEEGSLSGIDIKEAGLQIEREYKEYKTKNDKK
jgi:hypothetical protein